MITGGHTIIYTTEPEADRRFFRDVLGLSHVDVGDGWLIFSLPPAEIAFHPSSNNNVHEFYFLCEDAVGFKRTLEDKGVVVSELHDEGWGVLMHVNLPGGGKVGVYEARHARPE